MKRIALIHDWLTSWGGAERVLEAVLEIYPEADIFSLVYEPSLFKNSKISQQKITTSFIDTLPFAKTRWRNYLPIMPFAVEQFDLRGYDIVISLSNAVAHGVLTRPDQLHVNYIYTPMRYAWRLYQDYLESGGLQRGMKGAFAKVILHYLRLWDQASSKRVDYFVAISKWIARDVKKIYGRRASVVYPPVDVSRFSHRKARSDFYLVVSRLVPYKKVEIIVEAFSTLGARLAVVGEGPYLKKMKNAAGNHVEFLGWQSDEAVRDLFETAKAFVHAGEEDFGITLLEAQAAGCPVIAFKSGGALETVIEGKTGVFFEQQTAESLSLAISEFENLNNFDIIELRANAEKYSKAEFKSKFENEINRLWAQFQDS